MWVEEHKMRQRCVLCGQKGPEALCWQIGDLTDCIVHIFVRLRTTFFLFIPHPSLTSRPAGALCSTHPTFSLGSDICLRPPPTFLRHCLSQAHISLTAQHLDIPRCPRAPVILRRPDFCHQYLAPESWCVWRTAEGLLYNRKRLQTFSVNVYERLSKV